MLHISIPTTLTAMTLALSVLASCAAAQSVPNARLSLVQDPEGAPMSAAAVDLGAFGYTESEYITEGTAQRYRHANIGDLSTGEAIEGDFPYRSRLLLRRPAPEAFNGTLVVEWTNVTAGQDIDFAFAEMHDFLLSQG